jgi:hypothetical protein
VSAHASPARLLGIRPGVVGRGLLAENLQRGSKSFLPGFDQLGFFGFLFAQSQRSASLGFQAIKIRESFLERCLH